ncbi:hypothetical protein [Algibacter mikhailovii]|uniref:hypothetical protein n=1 Tax=Algibacter mikhailovii TaxID=425498 RepID=UPI0024949582|nr:hypothetical protein [Algibacter mikhailovii]
MFKNGDIQNDIGINLKYTWVGRGIIDFRGYERQIDNLKQEVIVPNNVKEVKDNIKNKVYEKEIDTYKKVYETNLPKKLGTFYEDKYEEIYSKMAEEEIAFIRKEKLYNFLWDHYVTFEALLPVTERSYNLLPDVNQSSATTETFMPWKTLLGYTSFWKRGNEQIIYLSAFGSVFNNNNAEIEKLDKFNLQQPNASNNDVIEKTTEVFIGDFEQFVTTNIKIEGVTYFLRKGSIGLSGALEQNFGEYDALNWKLGVPFSLKDKKGKPTVNFELQWKEVNKNHLVGIGVGFAFGKFIN